MSLFSFVRKLKVKIPFFRIVFNRDQLWSIGICSVYYNEESPLRIEQYINNPILTSKDIKDRTARMIADPFIVYENGLFYMFFEVLSLDNGDIGLATSKDGIKWEYKKIILDEPFHLSYPLVFKYKGDFYMIPETSRIKEIRIYKADKFPFRWKYLKTLIKGYPYIDSTILFYNNIWWLFTNLDNKTLKLFYSEDFLNGEWVEHPKSPLVENNINFSRPSGNIVNTNNRIIRFAQDGYPTYGNSIRAFEIKKLTLTEYEECELPESPLLKASGNGWDADGLHQISTYQINENKWLACIDGKVISKENCIYINKFKIKLSPAFVRLIGQLLKN